MSYYDSDARRASRGTGFPPSAGAQIDAGLRAHMQRVYGYMAGGLALTGIVAYAAAASGFYQAIAATPLIWLVMLAPLGFVLVLSFGIQRMRAETAMVLFWLYAAVMGLSLGTIFLGFTGESIARVFFITAAPSPSSGSSYSSALPPTIRSASRRCIWSPTALILPARRPCSAHCRSISIS